jgi:hypothetical protein
MKRLLKFLPMCLWVVSATVSFAQLQDPAPPINLIIDSDMAINADDVGDHAVMWALSNRGEVNVLALIASSANDYTAPTMRVIANYYGHPNIPIGAYQGSIPAGVFASSGYTQEVTDRFGTPGDIRSNYPDAVTVYRQALAGASDNSVYIVSGGFFQPLQALLQSLPDSISPLSGLDLVRAKVRRLIPAAGWFPGGDSGNFRSDPDGASYVFAHWPGEIVSVGDQVCGDVVTAPSASSDPTQDPIKYSYDLYGANTFSWTQCALLYAARGIGTSFSVGGYNGQTVIADSTQPQPGSSTWSQTPSVGDSYILKQIAPADMAAIVNPLLQSSSNMPILRSTSPANIVVGSPGQSVTLNGSNFFADSQVLISGNSRPTTFVNATQLTMQLNDADLAQIGTQALSVANSSEGNWTSNTINLNVFAPTPALTGISPSSGLASGGSIVLTATGSSFTSNSSIQVNGANHGTNFVSNTQLTTTLTTADLAAAGYLPITVTTAGGGTSSSLTFTINNPQPSLSSISPATVLAGSSGFTLTVNGAGFVPSSVVRVNGSDHPTTFVSQTQLTAAISATEVAVGGYLSVTVFDPAPGGGASTALTLIVNNPMPSVSSVSPNPVVATGNGFTLDLSGSGFVVTSVVQFDGTPVPTTFVSPTELQAQISNTDIIAVGQHMITVFNPSPGGGTSNGVTVTIVRTMAEITDPTSGANFRPEEAFSLTE